VETPGSIVATVPPASLDGKRGPTLIGLAALLAHLTALRAGFVWLDHSHLESLLICARALHELVQQIEARDLVGRLRAHPPTAQA
jgi:hypothetical protein